MTGQLTELDLKINRHFAGLVVRKDLVKLVKGNAIVPGYVLEYLLGQYCATDDEAGIEAGVETVKGILARHLVHRAQSELVKSTIREKGRHRIIDKVSVELNDKRDVYEATFSNLGISSVLIDADTIKRNPKLLVSGVWCICDIEYQHSEDRGVSPWILATLKPIQLSNFDVEGYLAARRHFSTEEWMDVLLQSIGFDPQFFGRRNKLQQLIRLIPYCERNYNLIELGPKGTGKSHVFSEFSPHGILISGGEVSVPKLFVNNSNGRLGLVGYWDLVAFDEFAGKKKRADKALVDIMKNYMANKSFSRGVEMLSAEASMVFVGNTSHSVPHMLKHSDLFDDLPEQYYDSAFLDRLHFYIPGWEVDIIRGEMFSNGYGFVVDYLAEILRYLRNEDYSHLYRGTLELSQDLSTRDRTAIQKSFSGLMKILYPHREATPQEVEELMMVAMEGRRRVKDQLLRIDTTYAPVEFSFQRPGDSKVIVHTLEEENYPTFYYQRPAGTQEAPGLEHTPPPVAGPLTDFPSGIVPAERIPEPPAPSPTRGPAVQFAPQEGHRVVKENQTGVTFSQLLYPWLANAGRITVTDPFIRNAYQQRNMMEVLEAIIQQMAPGDEVAVHLITCRTDLAFQVIQDESFGKMQRAVEPAGIQFTWEYQLPTAIHARHIVADTGWKILLDRGLDIYLPYDGRDPYALANRLAHFRSCRPFEVTWVRV